MTSKPKQETRKDDDYQKTLRDNLEYIYDNNYLELTGPRRVDEVDKLKKCIETKDEIIEYLTDRVNTLKMANDRLQLQFMDPICDDDEDEDNNNADDASYDDKPNIDEEEIDDDDEEAL